MPILDFLKKKPEEIAASQEGGDPGVPRTSMASVHGLVKPLHLAPLVTEKSTALQALHQYCVQAPYHTTKPQVRAFLTRMFQVHPLAIRMVPMAGRYVRYGRTQGKTRTWKKYIVQLPANEKLDMHVHKTPSA